MIFVGRRYGNTTVGGGLFALLCYAVFVWPFVFVIRVSLFVVIALFHLCAAIVRGISRLLD